MAGDWIPMRCNLANEPEVIAVAAAIGVDEDAVVGKLHRLWSWANQHTTDGNARGVTYSWVDRYLNCEGFAAALESQGWLTRDGGAVHFPKFDRFNSQGAKSRALTAKRVAEHKSKSNAKANGASVSGALPREEKRREEESSSPLPPRHLPPGLEAGPKWAAVEEVLESEGLLLAGDAVAAARARECTPGKVLEVLEVYRARKPAFGPGALLERIQRLRMHQSAGDLWPEPTAAAKPADGFDKTAELERQRRQSADEQARERARLEALEAAHAPAILKMKADRIREVIRAHNPDAADVLLRNCPGKGKDVKGMLRLELLEALEARAHSESPA